MNEFELTHTHIQLLRKAVIFWDSTEGGAPFIGAYGDSIEGLFSDVGGLLGLPALDKDQYTEAQAQTIGELIMEMGTVLQIALTCGAIEVGDYSYPNPLLTFYPDGTGMAASEIYLEDYGADERKTIDFRLRPEHVRLFKRMWAGWLDYAEVAGINSKYPYGSRAYYQVDMAEILGLGSEVSDELHNELEYLHQETQPAFQVFVQHVEIAPGSYEQKGKYSDEWMKRD